MKMVFMTRCNKPEGECNKLSFNILSSLFVCWQYIKKIGPLKPSLEPYLFLAEFERQFFLDKNQASYYGKQLLRHRNGCAISSNHY